MTVIMIFVGVDGRERLETRYVLGIFYKEGSMSGAFAVRRDAQPPERRREPVCSLQHSPKVPAQSTPSVSSEGPPLPHR